MGISENSVPVLAALIEKARWYEDSDGDHRTIGKFKQD
jgi:hypothetical protein